MIGIRPVRDLAPLDYRYALDASIYRGGAGKKRVFVRCNGADLLAEVEQRLPDESSSLGPLEAALWVEPLLSSWSTELEEFTALLTDGARLTIVASRPLARLLPGGCGPRVPLGSRPWGMARLSRALRQAGFVVEQSYGVHTMQAILLNRLSQQVERLGQLALADRLYFAARLRYCSSGPLAAFSTVAILVARKEERCSL